MLVVCHTSLSFYPNIVFFYRNISELSLCVQLVHITLKTRHHVTTNRTTYSSEAITLLLPHVLNAGKNFNHISLDYTSRKMAYTKKSKQQKTLAKGFNIVHTFKIHTPDSAALFKLRS